jgi:hypothetical protein
MKRIESKSYFDLKKFADDMGKATPIPFTGIAPNPTPAPTRRPFVSKDPIQQLEGLDILPKYLHLSCRFLLFFLP